MGSCRKAVPVLAAGGAQHGTGMLVSIASVRDGCRVRGSCSTRNWGASTLLADLMASPGLAGLVYFFSVSCHKYKACKIWDSIDTHEWCFEDIGFRA